MTPDSWLLLSAYTVLLLVLAWPLGAFIADVLEGRRTFLTPVLGPVERACYRIAGVRADEEMGWRRYAMATLAFNLVGLLAVYLLQRLQGVLPLNPQHLGAITPDSAFNTAVSFATNTNWQGYGGETTMSDLTQMLGLAVQNFVSAATGIAVLAALTRGITRRTATTVGNFWADLVRSTVHVLLPLAVVLALVLVGQGVVQTFSPYREVPLLEPVHAADGSVVATQTLALGPAASQVAIKQLGTNGGGFFNVNSAHPFENPTPLTNLLELLSILIIPAALCFTFGRMVGDRRQGIALIAAMTALFLVAAIPVLMIEEAGSSRLAALGVDAAPSEIQPGGNMEGKEVRFGPAGSALWAVATTAASNGSVNAMHDSFMPLGGMIPMVLMQLGEVVYGGVGSGLYGMLIFVLVAVFVSGLMVGRTPEYLGKKIEAFEMKMAALVILIPPALVLLGAALAVATASGRATIFNPGVHGFSEVLYAFSSAANNNGSAFAGLGANTPFYNTTLGIAMFFARYALIVPVLALAGSLAAKKKVPAGLGTLPTHTPLFVAMLVSVVIVVAALTFVPALALGPIVEHLLLAGVTP
jgi:potassium-transporting ATPase potassium-binding subunit